MWNGFHKMLNHKNIVLLQVKLKVKTYAPWWILKFVPDQNLGGQTERILISGLPLYLNALI